MTKKKYYCWACDFSKETGEGQLARLFVEKKFRISEVNILTPDSINTRFNFLNKFLKHKYISPIFGIYINWFFYIKRKKTIYINYLPLWNFLIFLLLPPQTILGPITGGSLHSPKNIIRRDIFPILYFISKIILYLRFDKLCFSTDLLKKYFNHDFIKNNYFNYVLKKIKIEKVLTKKNIDFLIYYRRHNNKIHNFPYNLIKKIKSFGFQVHVIGDRLDIAGIKNHGYQKNYNVKKLLSRSRFSICSQENLLTFFTIECINFDVKILIDFSFYDKIKYMKEIKAIRKKFIFIDLKKNNFDIQTLLQN